MPNERIMNVAGLSIDLDKLTAEQTKALFAIINRQARQVRRLSQNGQQLTQVKLADLVAELAAEIKLLLPVPAPVKSQAEQFKPIIGTVNHKAVIITSLLDEAQKKIDVLIERDKQNFQQVFNPAVKYTDDIDKLSELVRQNYQCKANEIRKFVREHNEILHAKHSSLTEQISIQNTDLNKLQQVIIDNQRNLVSIKEQIKQVPKLSIMEKIHLADKSTGIFAHRLIARLTKLFYPEAHLTVLKQRQEKLSQLLQQEQTIPAEIKSLEEQAKKLNADIADRQGRRTLIFNMINRFTSTMTEAINTAMRMSESTEVFTPRSVHRRCYSI